MIILVIIHQFIMHRARYRRGTFARLELVVWFSHELSNIWILKYKYEYVLKNSFFIMHYLKIDLIDSIQVPNLFDVLYLVI